MAEHRLANILRAIADGKVVQYQTPTGGAWTDFNPDVIGFPTYNPHLTWRIKPKPLVKKWRWVYKERRGYLGVSTKYYNSSAEFNKQYSGIVAIQRVESTMIEVEEDDE